MLDTSGNISLYAGTGTAGYQNGPPGIAQFNQPTAVAIDLSGNWYRNGTNKNVITRISDRVYTCDNATGYTTGDDNNLKMTFYNLDDTRIYTFVFDNLECFLLNILNKFIPSSDDPFTTKL